jgi:hypothetical protein
MGTVRKGVVSAGVARYGLVGQGEDGTGLAGAARFCAMLLGVERRRGAGVMGQG